MEETYLQDLSEASLSCPSEGETEAIQQQHLESLSRPQGKYAGWPSGVVYDARCASLPSETRQAEVRCRRRGLWFLIAFGAFLSAAGLAAPLLSGGLRWPAWGMSLLLGGPYLAPTLWGAVYLAKARVVADAEGLRWRGAGRWRTAAWADVTDYFNEEPPTSSSRACVLWGRVQTRAGTLRLPPGTWTNEGRLRARIAQSATQAASPGWRVLGRHLGDMPLVCRYDTVINRHTLCWMDRLHGIGLAAVVLYFGAYWLTTRTLPGWGWLLTPTGLFFVGKQTLPLLIRPTYRETQRRLGWRITAETDGLRFTDPESETRVAWEDVTDFYTEGLRSVIVTPEGERDFLDTLTGAERLKAIIPQLAVNAGQTRWRTGAVRQRRVRLASGEETVRRFYHYRSLENCGRLWGVSLALGFLCVVAAGPALIAGSTGAAPGAGEASLAGACVLGMIALAWLWGQYWTGGVSLDEEGITHHGWPGERRMAWDQMRGFRWRGNSDLTWGCVNGLYGRLYFWKGIGDGDRLAAELAMREATSF